MCTQVGTGTAQLERQPRVPNPQIPFCFPELPCLRSGVALLQTSDSTIAALRDPEMLSLEEYEQAVVDGEIKAYSAFQLLFSSLQPRAASSRPEYT